jgi:signal transduction histidine kinase/ActR/RegA family two-component response regulator
MIDVRSPATSLHRAPAFIGPLIPEEALVLRYSAAVALVLLIGGARAALAPLLGTQAPLLPFLLAVFISVYLGGKGPALLASLLTPLLATLWFTTWPHDAPPWQWLGHVAYFVGIALLTTFLLSELQWRSLAERAARQAADDNALQLRLTADALREANRQKDDFLAMLAHELRNPLAPIRNVAQILANGSLDANVVRQSSELLRRQANQLTRLVDDLLDVARIRRGSVTLQREPVDVERCIEMAIEAVQPQLDQKQQTVVLHGASDTVMVDGDAVRLGQVLSNLLTNASKYSAEGTHIRINIEGSADEVTVRIRDEGIGIDAQMLPQVFELFVQGDRSLDRSGGGLGIGLTIARHLVEMHGGSVVASSDGAGKGSEFCVRLPRLASVVRPAPEAGASPVSARAARRVLVIEDNRDAAESLRVLLGMEGHEVIVAHDGAAALAQIEGFRADVVLLDIGLPGMDGYMVAHAIRARDLQPPPRLLALTGYGRDEDRHAALAAGFDDHLTKPVDPVRLLTIIAAHDERRPSAAPTR